MKTVYELIGAFIVSLFLISIPVLCTLSFVYDWYAGLKFLFIVACVVEYFGLVSLLSQMADKQD